MELSRYMSVSSPACCHVSCSFLVTHVERRKLGAVRVEGLVVVLGELLCMDEVSVSQAEYQGRVGAYGR